MIENNEKMIENSNKIDFTEKERKEYWSNIETLITKISSRFLGSTHINNALNAMLRDIGALIGVSRSYIFQFSEDRKIMTNTHEWCAGGISPRVHKLQDLKTSKFPWWMQQLEEGKIILLTDIEILPEFAQNTKDFLSFQNIKSVLILPLYMNSILKGFIGFDSVNKRRKWQELDFLLLSLISQKTGNALERSEFEETIKQAEEKHKLIVENINELVIIVNEDLKFEYINNDSLSKLLGYRSEHVIGTTCLDYIHKDDQESVIEAFGENPKSNERTIEIRIKKKDGNWEWFECQGRSFKDSDNRKKWLLVSRNIDERKSIEERYKNLFENSPNAILLIDLKGCIIECNSTTNQIFGCGKEYLIGKSYNDLNELFNLDIRHFFKKIFQASFSKDFPHPIESKIVTNNDHFKWVKIQASVIKQKEKTLIQLIFQDITEKKRGEIFEDTFKEKLEEKVQIRTEELNNALEQQKLFLDQIVKSSQFKTEFMATMSHELRTPLNAIIGFTDLLLEGVYGMLTEEQQEFVSDIKSSAEHQFEMIKHILDISKIESGQIELSFKKFSINNVVEQVESSLKPLYKKKNLQFNINGLENDNKIYADPIRFKEILLNLLSNAIKFTIDGTISLTIKDTSTQWVFKINDTGIGIAPKDFPLIFKEFKRVDSTYVRSVPGTGLGLSLTKRLVELHGGEINFTSVLGIGSTFLFTISKKLEEKNR